MSADADVAKRSIDEPFGERSWPAASGIKTPRRRDDSPQTKQSGVGGRGESGGPDIEEGKILCHLRVGRTPFDVELSVRQRRVLFN